MKRWMTEYIHTDGSAWGGPEFRADTRAEAEAYALEYPCQPLRVVGEIMDEVDAEPDRLALRAVPTSERLH